MFPHFRLQRELEMNAFNEFDLEAVLPRIDNLTGPLIK
jgi:hypothetical protein